jgi:hypothetical protein
MYNTKIRYATVTLEQQLSVIQNQKESLLNALKELDEQESNIKETLEIINKKQDDDIE